MNRYMLNGNNQIVHNIIEVVNAEHNPHTRNITCAAVCMTSVIIPIQQAV